MVAWLLLEIVTVLQAPQHRTAGSLSGSMIQEVRMEMGLQDVVEVSPVKTETLARTGMQRMADSRVRALMNSTRKMLLGILVDLGCSVVLPWGWGSWIHMSTLSEDPR
jgi:hypothetical protein